MSKPLLLLVDGNALVYRAYHAFPKELTAPDGSPTGATFGFCRILFAAIKTLRPTHLAVAFDLSGPTFRHEKYAGYKATRAEMPDDLRAQIPLVHQIVETMEAPIFAQESFEADDMIGTISRLVEKDHKEVQVVILSSDQDLIQLVTDHTSVYSPGIAPKQPTMYTPAKVEEKYGFEPLKMIDYKALRGDPSDNIPGVPGIGEVTATQILKEFGDIENLYKALEKGETDSLKAGVVTKLKEGKDKALLSYELATIKVDVPTKFDLDACRLELQRPEQLVTVFRELNFKSLLDELPGSHKLAATAADVFGDTPAVADTPEKPREKSQSEQLDDQLAPVLREMENRGAKVDLPYLKDLEEEFQKEILDLTDKLHHEAGQPFNPDSPMQVAHILYEQMKIPTDGVRKGKTGYTTDADTLGKLAEEHVIAQLLLQYRERTKLQSTYIKPLQEIADEKGRVHTNYAPDTATGRISSRNPNLQNIPTRSEQGRRIRRAFITEPKWSLLAADYSQIELRIAAHLSKDPLLIESFNKGGDFHEETAKKMGVSRHVAKVINFSILYGKGPFSLSHDLGSTIEEAKQYIEQYFTTFKVLRKYLDEILANTRTNGYGETMFGRRRPFPDITSSNFQRRSAAEREALNLPFQGTQAEILKLAMSNLDKQLKSSKSEARMILTVHDELVLEVPDSDIPTIANLVRETMVNAVELIVPIKVDVKAGKNWAELEPIS